MSILIVEDSYPVMIRLVRSLKKICPKNKVYEASTGLEAIALFENNKIERVILDLGLPDISGISVLRHIRSKDPGMKVFVFTNQTEPEVRSQCMKEGAELFLDKTTELENLLDQFRR